MSKMKLKKKSMAKPALRWVLNILMVIGLLPIPPADASLDAPIIERTNDIRQRLLKADQATSGSSPQAEDKKNEQLAGWYNFPNFPNWPNWGNWGNGWRNY